MGLLGDFRSFAFKGNVVDLAVAFIIGAAFGTVVRSLVDDVIMPPVGYLLGDADFRDLYWVVSDQGSALAGNATLDEARAAGAVVVAYGQFLNSVIALLIVAFALFLVVRSMKRFEALSTRMRAQESAIPGAPLTKECPYCLQSIPVRALRCGHCTSTLADEPAPDASAR